MREGGRREGGRDRKGGDKEQTSVERIIDVEFDRVLDLFRGVLAACIQVKSPSPHRTNACHSSN